MSNQVIATFFLSLILAFCLTGMSYLSYRRKKRKEERTAAMTGLLKTDRKAFEEIFRNISAEQSGIAEIIVVNGKEGKSDFVIGVRMEEGRKLDYEFIKNELHKKFFKKIIFVFINLNAVEANDMFARGTRIGLKK